MTTDTGWEETSEQMRRLAAQILNEDYGQTLGPRYRYFGGPSGEMFCWSTEPVNGKFVCWTYRPYGKGARSGKATKWRAVDKVNFARRNKAKARAILRLERATSRVAEAE